MYPDDLIKEAAGQTIRLTASAAACREALAAALRKESGPVVAFTGNRSADASGAWRTVEAAAGDAGRAVVRFAGIEAEPSVDTVVRMAALLAEVRPGSVVALGGGSVLDAAKAAWLVHQSGWSLDRHFGVDRFSSAYPGHRLKRILAIPTTSGTGSEATGYSNIVDRALGVKKLVAETEIVPSLALVVPEFTAAMPRELTLATGCDALAHLIEGWLNIGADAAHPEANRWAAAGVELIRDSLPAALADPGNADARRAMALAAALGGMVIRVKSTGLPHLCSFSWYGRIAHGIAVALLLPAAWRYYLARPEVAERTMEMARFFPGSTPEAVVASFRSFLDRIGVPASLRAFPGITPELLERTALSGRENPMKLALAPRPVPLDGSSEILRGILADAAR